MPAYRKWLVLAVLSSALLLITADVTVLYTALPTLTRELQASASSKLWIVNAYALVVAGLLPSFGALGDRFGHRRFFILGLYVFGVASLCAAYATSPGFLIAARALLAVGAAMMMPSTLAIIQQTFNDERERSMAIGIWSGTAAGGAALGPVIGGVLLDHFWWGSVFLINVPIVVIAILLALRLIAASPPQPDRVWDGWSSMQIMIGLIGLTYAVKEAGMRDGTWETALLAALIGGSALWLFIRRQRRLASPLIDLNLFGNRSFTLAVLAGCVASATISGFDMVLMQRLQLVADMSPLHAALLSLPIALGAIFAAPITGAVLHRFRSDRVLGLMALVASAALAGYVFVFQTAIPMQVICLFIFGAGIGAVFSAASSTVMHIAHKQHAGMAASIEEVSLELGASFGVTLMGTLLSFVYTYTLVAPDLSDLPPRVRDSLDDALLVSDGMTSEAAHGLITAAQASYDQAFVAVLVAGAALMAITAIGIFLFGKRTPATH